MEATTQRKLPMATSNHIPSAQPVNEAIPATKAVLAAQAGVEPAKLPASRHAITATGSATKAKPLALPSANRHHAAKVSSLPDTAASVTTVASATATGLMIREAVALRVGRIVQIRLQRTG